MVLPPVVVSVQVGRPATRGSDDAAETMDQSWTSAFYKEAVLGLVHVGRTNLAGDEQADLRNHGGADKAVCVYSTVHYLIGKPNCISLHCRSERLAKTFRWER